MRIFSQFSAIFQQFFSYFELLFSYFQLFFSHFTAVFQLLKSHFSAIFQPFSAVCEIEEVAWFKLEYYVKIQQAPNPAAQFPSLLPPLSVHSELVKQVPVSPLFLPVHWLKYQNLFLKNSKNYFTGCLTSFFLGHPVKLTLTRLEMRQRRIKKKVLKWKKFELRNWKKKSRFFVTFLSNWIIFVQSFFTFG